METMETEVLAAREQLLAGVASCDSVRSCALSWYILARFFRPKFAPPPEQHFSTAKAVFQRRVLKARRDELRSRKVRSSLLHKAGGRLLARNSALLLRAEGGGYADGEVVRPFLAQMRCYAERHGVAVHLDEKPRLRPVFFEPYGPMEALASLPGPNASWLHRVVGRAMDGHPASVLELATGGAAAGLLAVSGGSLAAWARPWALEEKLPQQELLVSMDLDMTVRPDAHDVDLVSELQLSSERAGEFEGHQVYLRDVSPFTAGDCVNGGFVALRNSGVSRTLLRLWREKLWWAGVTVSEQGALAESILELLALEKGRWTGRHYASECVPLLFPSAEGVVQWNVYCYCWRKALEALVGPYRRRQSSWVGFVNPERLDVNYTPYSFISIVPAAALSALHLGPGAPGGAAPLSPFIVHWAVLRAEKRRLMEEYLERFNASVADFSPMCRPPPRGWPPSLGTPPIHDVPERRAICLDSLPKSRVFTSEFAAWWGGTYGCRRLLGSVRRALSSGLTFSEPYRPLGV